MNITVGKTLVAVVRTENDKQRTIWEGVVTKVAVDQGGSPAFVRIFNHLLKKGMGYQTEEFFCVSSKMSYVKIIGELKYPVDISRI